MHIHKHTYPHRSKLGPGTWGQLGLLSPSHILFSQTPLSMLSTYSISLPPPDTVPFHRAPSLTLVTLAHCPASSHAPGSFTLRDHTPVLCLVHLHLSSLSSWTPLPSNPTSSSSLTFLTAAPLTFLLFLLTHCLSSLNSLSFPSSTSPLMCPHSCLFPVLEAGLYAQR